jgi:hypothetical protein
MGAALIVAFFRGNTEGSLKTHKRLTINPIVKRFKLKKGKNTEGVLIIELG